MTQEELNEKLKLHSLWLSDQKGGKKADLSDADLSDADLSSANMSYSDLRGANLSGANLSGANLRSADLNGADLSGADLRVSDLYCANLSGANLERANLYAAELERANVDGVTGYPLINFIAGSTNRLNVYDAHLDVVHCGCWKGSLAELTKRVAETYPNTTSKERISYDNAIKELLTQKHNV